MQRVILVSLLFIVQSSTAIGQRPMVPDKAEEALHVQQGFRLGVIPNPTALGAQRKLVGQVVIAQPDLELEAKQLTVQLAIGMVQIYRTRNEPMRSEVVVRSEVVEVKLSTQLARNAEARIPPQATAAQRAKLHSAAGLDIRRKKTEFASRFNVEGVFFVSQLARNGGEDMFGPDSLFAKVMRHQGLQ